MATTNHERVNKALELLRSGLAPFVRREVMAKAEAGVVRMETIRRFAEDPKQVEKPVDDWDAAALLKLMWETWHDVFRDTLGFTERSLVSELRDWRNKWAHQERFSSDDADRAMDSAERLLTAVSAAEAIEVAKIKRELRRLVLDEQVRGEKRRVAGTPVEAAVGEMALKPWREVTTPHPDVANGRYQQAEFAADLWQVYLGEGADEYRDPREFFRRTYLTESLRRLLATGLRRLAGQAGDPVVQLQTNFGGGKTHSMLALYHLFSGAPSGELLGVDDALARQAPAAVAAKRVVLVGNKISPGNPATKPDGTEVRTLWGELAYQLGGKAAFERIRADDENATNPGDALRELLRSHGPCLILIDEWVSYARQLHDGSDLPGGSFETQFTFAQTLTEAVKATANCLLVVSLPASDTSGQRGQRTHGDADDSEVGGIRGREALERLRNVVARVESSWRPASAEESFEIVRRRLFEPFNGPDAFKQRDVSARAFADLYRAQQAEFPSECRRPDYERRIQAAFPIHPEIFDRLYSDWSALAKFQRTRGVLRLMAAVIHSLWESGDRNPLILPSTIPIDDARVQNELTRYLPDNWTPVIETDVDGPNSLPLRIDAEVPNLGKLFATRRVARTVYLGSAPTTAAAHRGIDDARVKLGCVSPGEAPAPFGDALRRLAGAATYLYQDGARVWYDTQPTVTKLAEDRAAQLARDPHKAAQELERRLRANLRETPALPVHVLPQSSADVPDDWDARLVVLSAEQAYAKETPNPAELAAKEILETRGTAPRLYRNTVVFLAADRVRCQDLDDALRRYLAWQSIVAEKEELNLDPHQTKQAEVQLQAADDTVAARLPEAYQWLLTPEQQTPSSAIEWKAIRLTGSSMRGASPSRTPAEGSGGLVERAVKRLRSDELLVLRLGGAILRMHMDNVPLWRGDHVAVRQLIDDFASYPYLPRLAGAQVLAQAVEDGVAQLTWETDGFALADGFDENAQRYLGLQAGASQAAVPPESGALLVKPAVARAQLEQEAPPTSQQAPARPDPRGEGKVATGPDVPPAPAKQARRFHGTVTLDPARVARDAGTIAEEVIAHLAGLVGADVTVSLDIAANVPDGVPENVVRTVSENSRTLKFQNHEFEES